MSQSLSSIFLHIVFSTKNRIPFIDKTIEPELFKYLGSISISNKVYPHKIGGMEDHVHLCVNFPRTISICDYLEEIKKSTSKWIKTKGEQYQDFSWQKGYGCFSVSFSNLKDVINYVENQKKHHEKFSFQDEYRKILKINKIDYDEKYVWD